MRVCGYHLLNLSSTQSPLFLLRKRSHFVWIFYMSALWLFLLQEHSSHFTSETKKKKKNAWNVLTTYFDKHAKRTS